MDAVDRSIIALLKRDARVPMKTIAGKVGLSRSAVRDRVVRLETAGVIRRYTIETDRQAGAMLAVLSIVLERTPSPGVIRHIVAMPPVRRCYSLSGAVDLLVEIEVADAVELNAVRDTMSSLAGVRSLTTAPVLRVEHDTA